MIDQPQRLQQDYPLNTRWLQRKCPLINLLATFHCKKSHLKFVKRLKVFAIFSDDGKDKDKKN